MYRIFKELETKRECKILNADKNDWTNTLIKFGIQTKPLIKNEYVEPIWRTYNKKHKNSRLIRIPNNVVVSEIKKTSKKSKFKFSLRK
jgi:hypothetical protein